MCDALVRGFSKTSGLCYAGFLVIILSMKTHELGSQEEVKPDLWFTYPFLFPRILL